MLIQAAALDAVHEQPEPVVTKTLPLAAAEGKEALEAERVKLHGVTAVKVVALARLE